MRAILYNCCSRLYDYIIITFLSCPRYYFFFFLSDIILFGLKLVLNREMVGLISRDGWYIENSQQMNIDKKIKKIDCWSSF